MDLMVQENLPKGCDWIDLPVRGDERGSLVAIEQSRSIPFDIARIYYLFGTTAGVTRGLHAHRRLNQFAVVVRGSCDMFLDDGVRQATVTMQSPARGLLLPPLVWHEMSNFSRDCVLLVAADAPYDEADYIRDMDEFRSLARQSAE
jgi:dTDP-4-dehydrorhamnose 3,5-epimerase-like enzyme